MKKWLKITKLKKNEDFNVYFIQKKLQSEQDSLPVIKYIRPTPPTTIPLLISGTTILTFRKLMPIVLFMKYPWLWFIISLHQKNIIGFFLAGFHPTWWKKKPTAILIKMPGGNHNLTKRLIAMKINTCFLLSIFPAATSINYPIASPLWPSLI